MNLTNPRKYFSRLCFLKICYNLKWERLDFWDLLDVCNSHKKYIN